VLWGDDYQWDYNKARIYYVAYVADRVEFTEPFDRIVPVCEANEFGAQNAAKVLGSLWIVATGPGHINENSTCGMKTHGIEVLSQPVEKAREPGCSN